MILTLYDVVTAICIVDQRCALWFGRVSLNFSGGHVGWGGKLPPPPPKKEREKRVRERERERGGGRRVCGGKSCLGVLMHMK